MGQLVYVGTAAFGCPSSAARQLDHPKSHPPTYQHLVILRPAPFAGRRTCAIAGKLNRPLRFAMETVSGLRFMLQLRLLPDFGPILFPHVLIDLDRQIAHIQTILPIATRSRNPILIAGFNVEMIRLIALEFLKFSAFVVEGKPSLREGYPTDSRRAVYALSLRFDIHDARLLARLWHSEILQRSVFSSTR